MRINFLYVIIVMVVLFDNNVIGQKNRFNDDLSIYNIGIELGPNLSSMIGRQVDKSSSTNLLKLGYSGGLFFQYDINSYFSLRTNISYSRKIYANQLCMISNTNENFYIEHRSIMSYINIPLLFKLNVDKSRFFFIAGPNFDFFLNNKNRILYDSYDTIANRSKKGDSNLDLAFGLGTNIPIGKKYNLSFEIRDNLGFTGIFKKDYVPYIGRNSVLFLYGLTYHFWKIKSK
jgi:hypothetical protein